MSFLISRAALIIKLILTVIALWLLLQIVSPGRLLAALLRTNPLMLALAIPLAAAYTAFKAMKWGVLVRTSLFPIPTGMAFRSYFIGMAVGLFTPGRVGELARVAYVPEEKRLAASSLVAFDKSMDAWAIVALAIPGVGRFLDPRLALAVAVGLAVWGLLLLYPGMTATLLRKRGLGLRLIPWTSHVDPKPLLLAFALTVAAFAAVAIEMIMIAVAFDPAGVIPAVLALPAIIVANSLPITLGGLGVREGVAVFLMGKLGVAPAAAALTAFFLFVFNTLLPALAGFYVAARDVSGQKQLDAIDPP